MAAGQKTGGRQKGSRNKSTLDRERASKEAASVAFGELTQEQVATLLPRDIFRMVAQAAVRTGNIALALKAASDWAPYEHARKTEVTGGDKPLVVEMVRRVIVDPRNSDPEGIRSAT